MDQQDNQYRILKKPYYQKKEILEPIIIKKKTVRTKKQKKNFNLELITELSEENEKAKIGLLKSIFERNKNKNGIWNKNLYRILTNSALIWSAHEKIRSNKGSMTLGVDKIDPDELAIEDIENIAKKIKNKEYRFKPVKRIYIEKPGKKTLRPKH